FSVGGVDFHVELLAAEGCPLVVRESKRWPYASSLRALLLRESFLACEVETSPAQRVYWYPTCWSGEPKGETIFRALRDERFVAVDHHDAQSFCGRKDDLVVYARAVEI